MNRKYFDAEAVPKMNLRLPRELRRELEESAKRNGRSLNAEVIQALRAFLEGHWR